MIVAYLQGFSALDYTCHQSLTFIYILRVCRDHFRGKVTGDYIQECRLSCTVLSNDSYFNRTAEHFCSHQHTPYDRAKLSVGGFVTENVGYIAWEIFAEYAEMGSIHLKYAVIDMIDRLLGEDKTATTTLPSQGIFAVMAQNTSDGTRLVNHIAYAVPKVRGRNTEIIEDIPTMLDTKVSVKTDKKPSRVYLAPSMEELDFTYADGQVSYTVPKFECSTLAVIEF